MRDIAVRTEKQTSMDILVSFLQCSVRGLGREGLEGEGRYILVAGAD